MNEADRAALEAARAQFDAETDDHVLTVRHDAMTDPANPQPYRHVRYARPGTGIFAVDIVTWPGHLAISGDIADLTFARLPDMFDFFRSGRPNPHYWAQKVVAGSHGTEYGRVPFSDEGYTAAVLRELPEDGELSEGDAAALRQAVEIELLDCPPYSVGEAIERLEDFRWTPDAPVRPEDVDPARDDYEFTFCEPQEMDFSTWDHHFLLACHAITRVVDLYLAETPDRLLREVA